MMSPAPHVRNARTFEHSLGRSDRAKYVLRLYITGLNRHSEVAVRNLKAICEEYLSGRYELEIIDIYQNPARAQGEQIIAAPTLVKQRPQPMRRFIGDLSDKQRVLLGLNLVPKERSSR